MADKEVGFGVIGLGMGAARAKTAAQTPGARLVAVADINEERCRKAADAHGCDTYEDYHKMLERDDVDVVLVMSPSGMHADMGMDAAAAGKHVVTTKPIDVSLEKTDRLIEACNKAGVVLAVDFNCRYVPDNWKVRKALDEGLFGRLVLGEARLKWWRGHQYFIGWHGTWAQDGGGSLMNQTVHQVDLLQWYMGPVARVTARFGVFTHDIESEDLVTAMLEFKNGAWGTILATTTFPSSEPARVEIHGDKGGVITAGSQIQYWLTKDEFNAATKEQNADAFPFEYTGPKNIIEEVLGIVNEGKQPIVTGEEARKSLELILAVYESGRQGKPVELPL